LRISHQSSAQRTTVCLPSERTNPWANNGSATRLLLVGITPIHRWFKGIVTSAENVAKRYSVALSTHENAIINNVHRYFMTI